MLDIARIDQEPKVTSKDLLVHWRLWLKGYLTLCFCAAVFSALFATIAASIQFQEVKAERQTDRLEFLVNYLQSRPK